MRERVVVGMSGGVDSSVAAALLLREGYDVVGVAMRLWGEATSDTPGSGCCSLDDFLDARRVSHQLGIPFYVMDFQEEFERDVVAPFVADYARGRTPNPCVRCNQYVKFGAFAARARELGAKLVATGHYARVDLGSDGDWHLRRGADGAKDQSYFLFSIPREELSRTRFPVGHLSKQQVRGLAAEIGLPVAMKPDSQEVCFAPGRTHGKFVARRLGESAPPGGPIVNAEGEALGEHAGVHTVTVGQRRGLGINASAPLYVTAVEAQTSTVRVGPVEALKVRGLEAEQVNWLVSTPPKAGTHLFVKIRSRHQGVAVCVVDASREAFTLDAAAEMSAVTPGQAAVLYDGERVVGGGWITRALP